MPFRPHSDLTTTPRICTNPHPQLLTAVTSLIHPFIAAADTDALTKHTGHGLAIPGGGPRTALVEHHAPLKLQSLLKDDLEIKEAAGGKEGLLEVVQQVLKYSVNTWDQGFLDKLYASTDAVGVVSELVLGVLNTNVRLPPDLHLHPEKPIASQKIPRT